jgi:hypothetical protein
MPIPILTVAREVNSALHSYLQNISRDDPRSLSLTTAYRIYFASIGDIRCSSSSRQLARSDWLFVGTVDMELLVLVSVKVDVPGGVAAVGYCLIQGGILSAWYY